MHRLISYRQQMPRPTEVIGGSLRLLFGARAGILNFIEWRLDSEFDEADFVSGVQLLTDNYGAIVVGNGQLNGVQVTNVSLLSYLKAGLFSADEYADGDDITIVADDGSI